VILNPSKMHRRGEAILSLSHTHSLLEGVMIVILGCALRGAISIFGAHADGMRERVQRQLAARSHRVVLLQLASEFSLSAHRRERESHKNAALAHSAARDSGLLCTGLKNKTLACGAASSCVQVSQANAN
jgi:hypothetical protein